MLKIETFESREIYSNNIMCHGIRPLKTTASLQKETVSTVRFDTFEVENKLYGGSYTAVH